jgi:hypothetical protein
MTYCIIIKYVKRTQIEKTKLKIKVEQFAWLIKYQTMNT